MCQIAAIRADRYLFSQFVVVILTLLITLAGFLPVQAQHIAGTDAPEFRRALELWLEGDDEASIPLLSTLAQDNNSASQILLGMIDKTAALQGPMIVFLPRMERMALLRAPGGLSGQNWMRVAALNTQYAKNWVALWHMEDGVEIAKEFASMNEPRATRSALLMAVNRQGSGFEQQLLTKDWYPQSLRHLTKSRMLLPEDVKDLHAGDPVRKSAGLQLQDSDLRAWLQTSSMALHLRAACDRNCAKTQPDCMLALYRGLNSYYALLVMGSPSATIIPEQAFAESLRGSQSVARHIMVRHTARTRDVMLRQLAPIDGCAVAWLEDEFRRFSLSSRTSTATSD